MKWLALNLVLGIAMLVFVRVQGRRYDREEAERLERQARGEPEPKPDDGAFWRGLRDRLR